MTEIILSDGNANLYGGGACINGNDAATLTDVTIKDNEAGEAAGLFVGGASTVTVVRGYVARNEAKTTNAGGARTSPLTPPPSTLRPSPLTPHPSHSPPLTPHTLHPPTLAPWPSA